MTRFILIAFLFVAGCNSTDSSNDVSVTGAKDTAIDDTYIATTPAALSGCYGWVVNNDSASMKISVEGNTIEGTLAYNWSEKDRNAGTLQGEVKDSLIIANYTFNSEGMSSVRQVVFKIQGDSLSEGFGDIDTSGDTTKFKNIAGLQFQNDRSFKTINCNQ